MSEVLFRADSYLREATATITFVTEAGGLVPDRSIFYPTGGGQPGAGDGQPGDSGWLQWAGGRLEIATTLKGPGDAIVLLPAEPTAIPAVGAQVTQILDWERRHHLMRMHTALHLLSVVIPLPVSGGSVGVQKSRLDFDMPAPPEDRAALQNALNKLIALDFMVAEEWISEADLAAKPDLVKTMSVQPPRGQGQIRLIRIGQGAATADLQPCGGTHVDRTSEIGRVRIGRIEKKGRQNRRVYIHLDD